MDSTGAFIAMIQLASNGCQLPGEQGKARATCGAELECAHEPTIGITEDIHVVGPCLHGVDEAGVLGGPAGAWAQSVRPHDAVVWPGHFEHV